tara:strand:- start:43 stop:1224 length:1182 start_codon:yes stop_codon:yes gene_type:complete
MRILLVFVSSVLPLVSNCQYSSYYNVDVNSNSKVSGNINVNKNVNVSGNTTQTIKTIDYGALANANAVRERNKIEQTRVQIEQAKYYDDKERQNAIIEAKKALEIAENPLKAQEYGEFHSYNYNYLKKNKKNLFTNGFKRYTENFTTPHKSLFQNVGQGRWENISTDGITTEMISRLAVNFYRGEYKDYETVEKFKIIYNKLNEYYSSHNKPRKKNYKNNKNDFQNDFQKYYNVCDSLDNTLLRYDLKTQVYLPQIKVGEKLAPQSQLSDSAFCHKKEVVKRLVYGKSGFRSTIIWEDNFEICITDNYISHYNNVEYSFKVRYKADKESNLSFQDLEGRRFYLSKLIDKHIASRLINQEVKVEALDSYYPKRREYNSKAKYNESLNLYWEQLH